MSTTTPTGDLPTEAAGSGPAANLNIVLLPLMLGALSYGVLGTAIVPALPLFERVLHTDETGATWLLTSYFLTAAGATAALGRLGDMFGKRRMLLMTLAILSVGSLISAVSDSLALEILGRALQGSAGGLYPLAFGVIRDEFPSDQVSRGISAITATISVGTAGLILPGLIIPHLTWRWLFWIPLILSLLAMAGTWRLVRESPNRPGGSVNWINGLLMMVGITATIIGLSEGATWGWDSVRTIALIACGLAVIAIWIVAEARSANPLINMSLMRLRGVWSTNAVAFMIGAGMYGTFAIYPIFAQLPRSTGYAFGASILQTGLYMLPSSVIAGVVSPLTGRIVARLGAVRTLVASLLVVAAGSAFMVIWHAHPVDMMVSLGLIGLGLGLGLTTLFTVVVHSVPPQRIGETTGMNTVLRMFGGAIGTQVATVIITASDHHGVPRFSGFRGSFLAEAAFLVIAALAATLLGASQRAAA